MFSKPNAIVYLRRSGLIVAGKHVTPARLAFPDELIRNLELLQPDKFIDGCVQFFNDHDLHGKRVLVVLDSSIVFSKVIDLDTASKPASLTNSFITAIPLDENKRAYVTIQSPHKLQIYATNAELYQAVAYALRACGVARLLAITPAAAYPLDQSGQQLGAAIEQFVSDTKIRQQANFNH